MIITRNGIGTIDSERIRDTQGSGLLPVQAAADAGVTFRVLGRCHPSAPWFEIKAAGSSAFLEGFVPVPYLRLEITVGAGAASLFVADD